MTICIRCGKKLRRGDRHKKAPKGSTAKCLVVALSRRSILELRREIDELLGMRLRKRSSGV